MTIVINKGFHYSCQKCGACCIHQEGTGIHLLSEDVTSLSNHLDIYSDDFLSTYCLLSLNIFKFSDIELSIEYFEIDLHKNKSCPFLVQNICSIHTAKPYLCNQGPFTYSLLSNDYYWNKFTSRCSGFRNGLYYSIDSILNMVTQDEKVFDEYNQQYRAASSIWDLFNLDYVNLPHLQRIYTYSITHRDAVEGKGGDTYASSFTENYIT